MAVSVISPFAAWVLSSYRSSRGTALGMCGNEDLRCTEMGLR